ncbi:hypothetical protein IM660_02425 [Ruania alkalisoli]|uniref:Spheroidene monooxygenase n=1 Tax=Ruania alkalisoli TaxID=2779775 RepID=A0A7M1SVT6_9MICO|nr:hypothetical protein [Ruania alkalisoli]QOR71187.1 hypothetical protein IM660_02425 [Ruania alkalisoli]
MHSFHLVQVPARVTVRAITRPPREIPGLRHLECLATMRLGAPVVSPDRMQVRRLAVFAAWETEAALERFLREHPWGERLATGWHVRLEFLRRWGHVAEMGDLPEIAARSDPGEPAVAVTLARMRMPELPRFVRWGRPVERLVRDHPGTTLALAAVRPPRTVSTFSVWRSTREMTDMVHGRSDVDAAARHADAMGERERRDFHHEFTTLRFRPLSEHGVWEGRGDYTARR